MAFWITLFRAMLAITLGVVLVFYPDKTRPMLANFMGMYWLASGIVSLRWGASGERARGLAILAGVVGVVAGLGALGRGYAAGWLGESIVFTLLGLLILLTGLLHMFGGFWQSGGEGRTRTVTSFLLGIFEAILGLLLIAAPTERAPLILVAASSWALLGGALLIGDALYMRRLRAENA
jgi:uncharacterized membrane protein HdeD (DUF308 family)